MNIDVFDYNKHKILKVEGDVDLYNVGDLKSSIFNLVDEDEIQSMVIDMSGINYMDSSGVGALVAGQKKLKSQGGEFALMAMKQDVLNILKLATLDQFFKIYNSLADLPA